MPTSAQLRVYPVRLLKLLLAVGLALALLSFFVQVYLYTGTEFRGLNTLVKFTNVDGENSLPSWYSSVQLFLCSLALFVIARLERGARRYARGWLGLAVLFSLLSIDETIQFHELVSNILEEQFNLSGFLYFAWVVPAALFVLILAGVYLRFLLRLPAKTRYLALAAGGLFLTGALGVEAVTARYVEDNGTTTLIYAAFTTVEEFLEMVGASLFLYTLVAYLSRFGQAVPLSFGELNVTGPVAASAEYRGSAPKEQTERSV